MAACDYKACDSCGYGKVYYDATVDYDVPSFGEVKALCADCAKKFELKVVKRKKDSHG